MNCIVCGREIKITDKKKYCSEKCVMIHYEESTVYGIIEKNEKIFSEIEKNFNNFYDILEKIKIYDKFFL